MSKNTGGPAFPVQPVAGNCGGPEQSVGISMRDYFAAKAMQGFAAGILGDGGDWPNREILAANAYTLADAMLKARAA